MQTNSIGLLEAGLAAAVPAFDDFLATLNWSREEIDQTCCHQVGSAHREQMLAALGLDASRDILTFDRFGNTGSTALPIAASLALAQQDAATFSKLALLGIGSGVNVVMLGLT